MSLSTLVRAHESTKRTAFYITSPTNILFKAAEEYRLPKRLRHDLGGALRDFTTRESHCFEQIKDDEGKVSLFTSQERQWLVLQVLQGLRASTSDKLTLQGRAQVEEGQSIGEYFNKFLDYKIINLNKLLHSSCCMARIWFDRTIISTA